VYDYLQKRDPDTLRRIYSEDTRKKHFIYFLVRNTPYNGDCLRQTFTCLAWRKRQMSASFF
jgi:hypothetical protein